MHPETYGTIESALYVDDLAISAEFYQRVLGFTPTSEPSGRLCAMEIADGRVLLLFKKGASIQDTVTSFGTIPATDGQGQLHVAFGISSDAVTTWRDHLGKCGVPVESTVSWPEGGVSLYFRDPDQHVLEFKTSNWFGLNLRDQGGADL